MCCLSQCDNDQVMMQQRRHVNYDCRNISVKEAIVKCDFNVELALNTLLNNPGVFHGGPE